MSLLDRVASEARRLVAAFGRRPDDGRPAGARDTEDPIEAHDTGTQHARVIERTRESLRARGEGKPRHSDDGRRQEKKKASGWNEAPHGFDNVLRRKKKARLSSR